MKNIALNGKNIVFFLLCLTSIIYTFQYAQETLGRAMIFHNLTYAGRELYIERSFKYLPVYEYSSWLDKLIPEGQPISLMDKHTNYLYYYSRMNYFLWPKYFKEKVNVVAGINDQKPSALEKLEYGPLIFAIGMKNNEIMTSNTGLRSIKIGNNKYIIAARYSGGNFILAEENFLKSSVLNNPKSWQALISEYKALYSGKKGGAQ